MDVPDAASGEMRVQMGVLERADGSALYDDGRVKVLAAVHGPAAVRSKQERIEEATVQVTVETLSSPPTLAQNSAALRLQALLEKVVVCALHPRSLIAVSVQPVRLAATGAEGDFFAAAFNASIAALMDAGVPLRSVATAAADGAAGVVVFEHTSRGAALLHHTITAGRLSAAQVCCAVRCALTARSSRSGCARASVRAWPRLSDCSASCTSTTLRTRRWRQCNLAGHSFRNRRNLQVSAGAEGRGARLLAGAEARVHARAVGVLAGGEEARRVGNLVDELVKGGGDADLGLGAALHVEGGEALCALEALLPAHDAGGLLHGECAAAARTLSILLATSMRTISSRFA